MNVMENAHTLSTYLCEEYAKKARATHKPVWKVSRMFTFDVDGKQITTNYGCYADYPYWNGYGNGYKGIPFGKTTADLLFDLINQGYTQIRFVQASTAVRGYCNVYAHATKKGEQA
jgi:hypothetical protein